MAVGGIRADDDMIEGALLRLARTLLALPIERSRADSLCTVVFHRQETCLPVFLRAGIIIQLLLLLPTEQISQ